MRGFFLFAGLLLLPLPLAAAGIVDALSLAGFVPLVLDAMMTVAMTGYEFFVGDGFGIIYILVWGWLGITVGLYLVRMYLPSKWLGMFGVQGDDRLAKGELSGMQIGEDLLKPGIRAIFAVLVLLQVRPQYITTFIVDPFLRFGAIYTDSIYREVSQGNTMFGAPPVVKCPEGLLMNIERTRGYISEAGCNFLIQPVAQITHANNFIIKRGFRMLTSGIGGLMTLIPRGGENFMNIITGFLLITTFVSSNFFMALLVIQGIFTFGMTLVLYPFKVLKYVAKPADGKAWFDPWDAFSDIIPALRNLVITMIASMFIMLINIAIVRALFNWNESMFVEVAGGTATANVPTAAAQGAMGFGHHSVTWLSAILTFYLMLRIFQMTREKLAEYTSGTPSTLYDKAKSDAQSFVGGTKKYSAGTWDAFKWVKNKVGK
ncbi:MAG: hypothetical protein FWE17_02055 [Alphaproteobacteria bacterium]|nr:hypothetical protein [Alphaproteobacteria bacterium]MCL2757882.1 hypothetical protein [Alphaproteobacteria bacterium]